MFTKEERSSFPYYFAHLFAFNMTALNLKCWKWRYLFHDWYKPWMKLFMSYERVQKFHRTHSNHHLEWFNKLDKGKIDNFDYVLKKFDWDAMLIDWECSRFTKEVSQINAEKKLEKEILKYSFKSDYRSLWIGHWLVYIGESRLKHLKLKKES